MRSTNGCWTCRLRRKKCDEVQPSCKTCTDLRIICRGYGPRPIWMDRGVLEREEAQKIKTAIARGGQRRKGASLRDKSLPSSISKPIPSHVSIQSKATSKINSSKTATPAHLETERGKEKTQQVSLRAPAIDLPWDARLSELDFSQPQEEVLLSSPIVWDSQMPYNVQDIDWDVSMSVFESFVTNELPEIQCTIADHTIPSQDILLVDGMSSKRGSPIPQTFQGLITSPKDQTNFNLKAARPDFDEENKQSWRTTHCPGRETHFESHRRGLEGSHVGHSSFPYPAKDHQGTAIPGRLTPDMALLLSHYIERVIPAQFPFSCNIGPGSMQWLQFLLFSSTSVLEISMIFSSAHHDLETQVNNERRFDWLEERKTQPSRVSAILRAVTANMSLLDEDLNISKALVVCTVVIQAVHFEVSKFPKTRQPKRYS